MSAPGKGSVFWFEIPFLVVDAQADYAADRGGEESGATGLNVLLVEDNAVNRMIAMRLLERGGISLRRCVTVMPRSPPSGADHMTLY